MRERSVIPSCVPIVRTRTDEDVIDALDASGLFIEFDARELSKPALTS